MSQELGLFHPYNHISELRTDTEILRCYGFPLLKSRIVRDAAEIEAAMSETGLPVAMKIISPDILHKSDAGGVRVKIKSVEQAQSTFTEIIENARQYNPAARVDGVLIEEMARDGLGMK